MEVIMEVPNGWDKDISNQELVRCKDCMHYRYYGLSEETVSECKIDHAENPDGNWFCADGIAKDINVPGKEGW